MRHLLTEQKLCCLIAVELWWPDQTFSGGHAVQDLKPPHCVHVTCIMYGCKSQPAYCKDAIYGSHMHSAVEPYKQVLLIVYYKIS